MAKQPIEKNDGRFKKGHIPWSKGKIGVRKGYKHSEETKRKIGLGNTGKIRSEEAKEKNRIAHIGKKQSPETIAKRMKNMYGENHPMWKKDRNALVKSVGRKDYANHNWSLSVKKRDGWKCKINNHDCNGRLESHHILPYRDYPELRFDLNNGITLCKFHHPRKRKDELKMVETFKELINLNTNL